MSESPEQSPVGAGFAGSPTDSVPAADSSNAPRIKKPRDSSLARWPDLTWVFMVIAGGLASAMIIDHSGLDYTVNDASRWNTVYMLTEHGTYRYKLDHGAKFRANDKFPRSVNTTSMPADEVERQVSSGQLIKITDGAKTSYYHPIGSPPQPGDLLYFPLFPTIDMVKLGDDYYSSKPPLLPTIAAGIVWLIERVSHRTFSDSPWLMIHITLLILQVIPLMAFVWVVGRYVRDVTSSWFVHAFCLAVASLATYLTPWAVTFNNHVIAGYSAMFALYAVVQIWYVGRREWYLFVVGGFFAAFAAVNEFPAAALLTAVMLGLFIRSPRKTLAWALLPALVPIAAFFATNYIATHQFRPVQPQFTDRPGPYYYPGSYWNNPSGVDKLNEPGPVYLMHVLVGHHGFFLLTPILVVGFLGMGAQLSFRSYSRPLLAGFVLATTAVVVCFYVFYTNESKNYGGAPQGTRWLFWLIPLWLVMLPPGVELMSRSRVTRGLLYFLLIISVFSAESALRQPWSNPWAQLLFRHYGIINY